jgi:MFS family permease
MDGPPATTSASSTTDATRRDLTACLTEGAAFGGMVGFGETYLPAFVLAIGLGEVTAGLISSVPLIAGGLMQMVSPFAVDWLKSHKRWVVICATVQCLSFVPFLFGALTGRFSATAALVSASLYWGAGLATGPAWNTWIETLVPRPLRARFFARRTFGQQFFVFAGFLGGGLWLQWHSSSGVSGRTFALLFATAAGCRLISAATMTLQREPDPIPANTRRIPFRTVWPHLKASGGGRLLLYLVAVQAAVQISGPYFTPFMFVQLGLSYAEFAGLLSAAFLAKVIALPLCGRIAHRLGAWKLLWVGGIGIVPLAGGWVLSQNFGWLLFLQVFGGFAWAAYELAFFLLFFESIDKSERTSVLTFYNLLNTTGWVCGALIGGLILKLAGTSYSTYLIIFGASSVARLLALALLARVRDVPVKSAGVSVRTVAVRPGSASLDTPVLPSLPDEVEAALVPASGN